MSSALRARPVLLPAALLVVSLLPDRAHAQSAPASGALAVAPSGRATTVVSLAVPGVQGATPRTIRIDYGQPHARGRQILGTVVPYDSVWRTGANASTTLTTDVDLQIGTTRIPKGSYSLFTLPSRSGWQLIVSGETGQWGTNYKPGRDVARVPLQARELREPLESFSIWLVPAAGQPARGTLRLAWGTFELSTDWRVAEGS